MHTYPVELNLAGREVVVVGGGRVARRKVAALVAAGAVVRVVSPEFAPELAGRADIRREQAAWSPDRLGAAVLVFACTDDRRLNAQVAEQARAAGRWCNVADDAEAGDFLVPAVLRQGDLTIAVGTGGAGPLLAAELRDRLGSTFGPTYAILVEEVREARAATLAEALDPATRRRILERICSPESIGMLMEQDRQVWRTWFAGLLAGEHGGRASCPPQSESSAKAGKMSAP